MEFKERGGAPGGKVSKGFRIRKKKGREGNFKIFGQTNQRVF